MSLNKNEEVRPGAVRKDLYAYLEEQGFKVTEERHKAIKTAIIMHTNATTEGIAAQRSNAMNALGNVAIGPKVQTIIDRMKRRQCPACGLDLKRVVYTKNEYEAECGHYPKGTKIVMS